MLWYQVRATLPFFTCLFCLEWLLSCLLKILPPAVRVCTVLRCLLQPCMCHKRRLSAPRHDSAIGICIKEQLSPAPYQEEDGHWIRASFQPIIGLLATDWRWFVSGESPFQMFILRSEKNTKCDQINFKTLRP